MSFSKCLIEQPSNIRARGLVRSSVSYITTDYSNLGMSALEAASEYGSISDGVFTFSKACRVLVHAWVASIIYSQLCYINVYKNYKSTSSYTSRVRLTQNQDNSAYQCTGAIWDMAVGDKIYALGEVNDSAGGSIPHYAVYVLEEVS